MTVKKWTSLVAGLLVLLQLWGCAGRQAFLRGEELLLKGNSEAAALQFFQAVQANPKSYEYRMKLQNARVGAAIDRVEAGRREMKKNDYRRAIEEFRQAAALDPTNEVALQEMKQAQRLLRAEELVAQGEEFYRARKFVQARNVLEEALRENPEQSRAKELMEQIKGERRLVLDGFELDVASEKPITLKFKDAEIRDVFTILSRLSGINFIFDEDVKAQKISIFLENATFAQALELLLRLNSLDRKVLNAKTILVYPQTKEKEKQFEDQIIQTFYLSNIEAKKAVNLLRTMLQLRKIYVHEELNALVVRDTPATIKLAQQIIEAADRSDSEVVFALELVEVSHTDALDVGPRLSPYAVSAGLASPGSSTIGTVTTSGLSRLDFLYTVPSATYSFQKTLTDSEILANPKIRVKNKEKAKVHIGSREPIITNTLTASGDVTSTNVQYVDVGVKLDIEPVVQLDNTVIAKVGLEVSNVSSRQKIGDKGQGGEALTISTTNAQTSLILKDGEQTVIGGLIRDSVTREKNTFPFLGQIPLIGSLISGHKREKGKREILLSITPHIVKNIDMPRSEVATIWSGGEDDLENGPRFGAFATTLEPEAAMAPPATAPALQPAASTDGQPSLPAVAEPSAEPPPPTAVPELQTEPVPAEGPEAVEPQQPEATEPPPEVPASPQVASLQEDQAGAVVSDAASEPGAPLPAGEGTVSSLPVLPIPPVEVPSRVELQAPVEVTVGEEFATLIKAVEVRNLYSAPLFVTFDAQRLEFVRAEEGDFLKAAGQSTVFTASADPQAGRLIVGYKQGVGGSGANGSGDLFRLVFRGKAPGQAQIALERLNFRDPGGSRLPVSGAGISLEVR